MFYAFFVWWRAGPRKDETGKKVRERSTGGAHQHVWSLRSTPTTALNAILHGYYSAGRRMTAAKVVIRPSESVFLNKHVSKHSEILSRYDFIAAWKLWLSKSRWWRGVVSFFMDESKLGGGLYCEELSISFCFPNMAVFLKLRLLPLR